MVSSTAITRRTCSSYRFLALGRSSGWKRRNQTDCPKYGPWPDVWKYRYCFSRYFSGNEAYESLCSLSYVSMRYSMIAPDSHRVRFVFGSVMVGTRPLGLMEM